MTSHFQIVSNYRFFRHKHLPNNYRISLMKGMRPQSLKSPFSLAPIVVFGHKPRIPSKLKSMSSGYVSEEMGSPRSSESNMNLDGQSDASSDGHGSTIINRPGSGWYLYHFLKQFLALKSVFKLRGTVIGPAFRVRTDSNLVSAISFYLKYPT